MGPGPTGTQVTNDSPSDDRTDRRQRPSGRTAADGDDLEEAEEVAGGLVGRQAALDVGHD
jgi:hypothetical protein